MTSIVPIVACPPPAPLVPQSEDLLEKLRLCQQCSAIQSQLNTAVAKNKRYEEYCQELEYETENLIKEVVLLLLWFLTMAYGIAEAVMKHVRSFFGYTVVNQEREIDLEANMLAMDVSFVSLTVSDMNSALTPVEDEEIPLCQSNSFAVGTIIEFNQAEQETDNQTERSAINIESCTVSSFMNFGNGDISTNEDKFQFACIAPLKARLSSATISNATCNHQEVESYYSLSTRFMEPPPKPEIIVASTTKLLKTSIKQKETKKKGANTMSGRLMGSTKAVDSRRCPPVPSRKLTMATTPALPKKATVTNATTEIKIPNTRKRDTSVQRKPAVPRLSKKAKEAAERKEDESALDEESLANPSYKRRRVATVAFTPAPTTVPKGKNNNQRTTTTSAIHN